MPRQKLYKKCNSWFQENTELNLKLAYFKSALLDGSGSMLNPSQYGVLKAACGKNYLFTTSAVCSANTKV